MKKSLNILILFFIPAINSFAQQNDQSAELKQQVTVDIINHSLKDSLVFPGTIKGNGLKLSYSISRTGWIRKTSLTAGYEQVNFENESQHSKQHSFSIKFSDAFNVLRKAKNISAYIGYAVSMNPAYISGNYESNNAYSWNSSSMLSLYQSYNYSWKDQVVGIDIDIPVAGAVYRPGQGAVNLNEKNINTVLTSFYSNPSFASIHNYRAINFSLLYERQVSDRFSIAARYNFNYSKWKDENAFTDKWQSIGLSLIYRSLH